MKAHNGYTLIELVITIAIIGILATISWNYFKEQQHKAGRVEAGKQLVSAATRQERQKNDTGSYTTDLSLLGGSSSENGRYTISVTADADTFTLTATSNGDEDKCYKLMIDQAGRRTSENKSGAATKGCWPAM